MKERSGLLAFGSFITDHNLAIDAYPPEDRMTFIRSRHLAAGGPGYNISANLRRLDPAMRVECQGLVGDDDNGRVVLDALARHGIDPGGMTRTREAPQHYVEVMSSRATGRRTFFTFTGCADLLDETHCDPGPSACRIFHVGAPGLHPRLDRFDASGGNGWMRVLARARGLGFRTNMEMGSLDPDFMRPIVIPCLPLLDSVVINDLEGEAVTEVEIRPGGALDWAAAGRACRRLREMGVRQVAAIHFPEGAVAVDADGRLHAQPSVRWPDERVVSAVGAGDAFAAGLVYGLHEGWPVARGLKLAVAVAAVSLESLDTNGSIGAWQACEAETAPYGYRAAPPSNLAEE